MALLHRDRCDRALRSQSQSSPASCCRPPFDRRKALPTMNEERPGAPAIRLRNKPWKQQRCCQENSFSIPSLPHTYSLCSAITTWPITSAEALSAIRIALRRNISLGLKTILLPAVPFYLTRHRGFVQG